MSDAVKPKLQVANGYELDFVATANLLQWLDDARPPRWNHDAGGEALGIAGRAAESLYSLACAAGFTRPAAGKMTPFGWLVRERDPHLTAPITAWAVHVNLSGNPRNLVWRRMVNSVLSSRETVNVESARPFFLDLGDIVSANSVRKHLREEVTAVLKAYSIGPLAPLAWLKEEGKGLYRVQSPLPPPSGTFGYALFAYCSVHRDGDTAVPVQDLARADDSPGRVLRLDESEVRRELEGLHREGLLNLESRADLDQIRLIAPPDPVAYLERLYSGAPSDV